MSDDCCKRCDGGMRKKYMERGKGMMGFGIVKKTDEREKEEERVCVIIDS